MGWKDKFKSFAGDTLEIGTLGLVQNPYDTRAEKKDKEAQAEAQRQAGMTAASDQAALNYQNFIGGNASEVGANFQDILARRKARMTGQGDDVTDSIRRAGSTAASQTMGNLAAQGIRGGLASKAAESTYRKSQADSANYLNQQRQQAEKDVMKQGGIAAGMSLTGQAGIQGAGAIQNPYQSNSILDGVGTVICTELHRQGLIPNEVYIWDARVGAHFKDRRPEVYVGYYVWAKHIAKAMKKSKILTKVVSWFAVPWAYQMAGHKSLMGSLLLKYGVEVCALIGKIIISVNNKEVVNG